MFATRIHARFQACLLVIVGLALLAQSLIPAGFMPGSSEGSKQAIVICSGFEQKTIYVADQENAAGSSHHADSQNCAYALTLVGSSSVVPMMPVWLAVFIYHGDQSLSADFIPLRSLNNHFPTGPPLFS